MSKSLTKSIIIGSDHAGFLVKEKIKIFLKKANIKLLDIGTFSEERVDYPDYGKKLALAVKNKTVFGILICGSGIGVSIAANRIKKIRAAVCYNKKSASLARKHNNANVLCLGARLIDFKNIKTFEHFDLMFLSFDEEKELKFVEKVKAIKL